MVPRVDRACIDDQRANRIQHRDGGIIRTLGVRQGDLVKEGQILKATYEGLLNPLSLLICKTGQL